MVSAGCWKCLSRSTTSQLMNNVTLRLPVATAAFSTTQATFKSPLNKAAKGGRDSTKGEKTLKIKKKAPPKATGKPPAAGERKALRKRIVLSNTNALEVDGLKDLDEAILADQYMVGKVVGLPGRVVDKLRASEAFKITQGWGLFRRPAILLREESLACANMLEEAGKKKLTKRLLIDGGRVTGKSLMLLHAMAAAFVKGWVVLSIPEAQEVVNAVTEYSPVEGTNPTLYSQNAYIAAWLGRIGKANEPVLGRIKLSQEHNLDINIGPDTSIARLCELGAQEPELSWPVFQAFWSEITAAERPPILMTLDSLQYIMQNSLYRDPEYKPIHAHDLAVINHFIQYFSGAKTLPNGGAIIAATSRSHAPISVSTDLAIEQHADRQAGYEPTPKDPFEKNYDARADAALKQVEVMKLQGLSKKEARGLMEYWAASGVLRSRVDERTVAEKWAVAGNGIVGEIQRGALMMRI